ncbi:MAG: D-aminoacyl-tRNA deacylase [Thermoplasmata archaeon]|nr:D-aminoacyl-tRNA deacylase [Thermoplasmata archaeon]
MRAELRAGTLVFVLSDLDPVAAAVAEKWGTRPSAEIQIGGVPMRELAPGRLLLRRPGRHIEDETLDADLFESLEGLPPTLVFPSIHRSRSGPRGFTVHPIGNPGANSVAGGTPGELVPADARSMSSALRSLDEGAHSLGMRATFESTHHGPAVRYPAFFAEVGGGGSPDRPSAPEVKVLSDSLLSIEPGGTDRVAVGAGGGHYVPHFTDLALRRRWAFGHLLSDHVLQGGGPRLLQRAIAATPGCEGILFARARDAWLADSAVGVTRLRESAAPTRVPSRSAGT